MSEVIEYQPAGFWRKFAALTYDSLIVLTLTFLGTMPLIPLMHGYVISPANVLYKVYLLAIVFGYFGLSWIYGQQTIGMRAWRLKIYNFKHERIDLRQALLRFCFAIPALLSFGVGYLWMFLDKNKLSWHDRWSRTYLQKVNR